MFFPARTRILLALVVRNGGERLAATAPISRSSRGLHCTPRRLALTTGTNTSEPQKNTQHTTDSYAKDDVDSTPPPSDSSVYRIDTTSDNVLKPNEDIPNTAKRNLAEGRRPENTTEEGKREGYQNIDNTYKTEGGPGLRYGGKEEWAKEKGPQTSSGNEGPDNKSKAGRL
ncbi:hypothetical protein CC1G_06503 [Coprinopsis cinerea okayama7|uniref:Uncharacterized protein n=1 Tax=Coprinopsis cinerea (strain Okayama-7 / 130 / ATCC MYA-4618 / FGSC 9003) TaxID=240176 RepID=A8NNC5_COPC7|nr:hypothetical protein CC1G_06503 [Coprinopsis cinerea okayama7\|eukprot:XP_001835100.1 hypothetical protein CC1G_06503 [Coprinopsis cinerea okayama7\